MTRPDELGRHVVGWSMAVVLLALLVNTLPTEGALRSHWLDPEEFAGQHGRPPLPDPILPTASTPNLGRIPGSFRVNNDGSASHTIPIQVPPGRNGIQPNLAVVYHSRSQGGILGARVKLSGLSAITRVGLNQVDDGRVRRMQFDREDRFALDGKRLVVLEGGYGHSGAEYRTKQDIFARIISYGWPSIHNGPGRFVVWTKSGRKLSYGANDWDPGLTAVVVGRRRVARAWLLNEVCDLSGNCLRITYYNDKNAHRVDTDRDGVADDYLPADEAETVEVAPAEIWYTSNLTAPNPRWHQRFVRFEYETHPEPRQGFIAGIAVENQRLLRQIKIGYNDPDHGLQILKRYQLDYADDVLSHNVTGHFRPLFSSSQSALCCTPIYYL